MADPYMPSITVEIAFTSSFSTPAASRTWTDVSDYVELHKGMSITFGRQDERSTADANQLTLTLDNTDGRFTAGRAASPYSPNVKIGRPIRVRVTPVGGSTVTRFVGFIDEWPVEWDGSDRYASATLRASSRLARLGLSTKMQSAAELEILRDNPVAYYTLGNPSGTTSVSDQSVRSASSLLATGAGTAVDFGSATGPGTDGLSAAKFADGQYLETITPFTATGTDFFCIRATVKVDALPVSLAPFLQLVGNGAQARISVLSTGQVAGPGVVGPNINDGRNHDVFLRGTTAGFTGNAELYVDGVSYGSTVSADTSSSFQIRVGQGFQGVVSHVALYVGASIAIGRPAAQAQAILSGFSGDRTDQRLARILEWAGVASSEVTTETGVETMDYQQTSGQSYVDALREVESTEGGVLFDGRDGNVGFHNRSHRYTAAAAATLNMASQHVGSDYSPKLDRTALVNDVTVTNPTSEQSARVTDPTSVAEYGVAASSATVTATTGDALLQRANWLVASYSTPRTRVPSLTVDVLAHQGLTPSAQTLLGVTVGDLLAVTNAPTQADSTSQSYFVEGYTESIGPESYGISYNLSPTYPTLNVLVLDDPVRGKLDSGNVLAL